MSDRTVHIVGAGLAGLSTAVRLVQSGHRVVIHEANAFAGGRCRSFHDPRLDCQIDNGNHLLLSGNRSARAYLALIGASGQMVEQPARFAFADLADGSRWTVAPNRGPVPWWIGAPGRRAPGTRIANHLAGIRLALATKDQTVAQALHDRGPIWRRFWEPLTLAAINATPERAAAHLLWPVLRETFLRGEKYCRPMLAPNGLGDALVTPAVDWLRQQGAELHFGRTLRSVACGPQAATALLFTDGALALSAEDRVVLALPPSRLRAVLPLVDPPDDDCSIMNAFFRLANPLPDGTPPILGVISGTAQWIFHRAEVISVTISAAGEAGLDEHEASTLAPMIWDQTRRALGLDAGTGYLAHRINKERRATFDQSPQGLAKRLEARSPLINLFLAGDATRTGLPATIEGAIRSGERAAALVAGSSSIR